LFFFDFMLNKVSDAISGEGGFFMLPYYSCPFVYGDRNSMLMPMPIQPMMPVYSAPYMGNPMMPVMEDWDLMDDMGDMGDMDFNPDVIARQPAPVVTNPPAVTNITLFKELTGYPNYGNPSGNADILYTGTRGTWTFNVQPFLFVPGNLRAQLVIRAVLDDHYNVPVNQYTARITVNGSVVHTGRVPLEHGTPAGSRFNNWRLLTFNINLRRNNTVTIVNTSTAGPNDWIAFDWMELRLIPR
jgi:hypothetical protein